MNGNVFTDGLVTYGPLAVVVGAAVAGVIVIFAIAESMNGAARRKQRRIDSMRERNKVGGERPRAASVQLKRDTRLSAVPLLDRFLRQFLPRPEKLRLRLSRTGRKISLGTYAFINTVLLAAITMICVLYFGLPPLIGVLVGLCLGIGLPHVVVGYLVGRRQKKFLALFPEAIDLMVRGLKSGLPISETLITVGQEMKDPIGAEFQMISETVRIGETPEQAVWYSVERTGLLEMNFFVTALSVQRETGGNLTETLENLSDVLRKRRQMKLKVKAMSSEARASAMIIASLPFVMFALIYLVRDDYVMTLFEDPRGIVMVVGGLTLMAVGALVMAKMVRFKI